MFNRAVFARTMLQVWKKKEGDMSDFEKVILSVFLGMIVISFVAMNIKEF